MWEILINIDITIDKSNLCKGLIYQSIAGNMSHVSLASIPISLTPDQIILAVKNMKKKEQKAFIEDLLGAASPEYLDSIKEARADYKAGWVSTHDAVFG